MRLRYETGIATLIHFLVMMLFAFVGGIASIVEQCHGRGFAECATDSVVSLAYILVLAGCFGFLAMLGYAAQDRRSHKLARLLMAAEGLVLVLALFQAQNYPNILGLITSVVDAAFAVWIIVLAFRLSRAKGGRIMASASSRPRRRRAISHVKAS